MSQKSSLSGRSCLNDRERGETVELPLTIAALRYRCRAASRASKGDSSHVSAHAASQSHAPNASPGLRRRRSQIMSLSSYRVTHCRLNALADSCAR